MPDAVGSSSGMRHSSGPVFTPAPVPVRARAQPQPPCPAGDRRTLAYGLLGPNAQSLTYRAAGKTVTQVTVGGGGGYLVGPAPGRETIGVASGSAELFPGALAITFKDAAFPEQRSAAPGMDMQPRSRRGCA